MSKLTNNSIIPFNVKQGHPSAQTLLMAALQRSFGSMVANSGTHFGPWNLLNPTWPANEEPTKTMARWKRQKIMLTGELPAEALKLLGLDSNHFRPLPSDLKNLELHYNNVINYRRAFERYDFTDEWNNLGYGKIPKPNPNEDLRFSITHVLNNSTQLDNHFRVQAQVRQSLDPDPKSTLNFEEIGISSFIYDGDDFSILWHARPVSSLDGHDWKLVEEFYANHRSHELQSFPLISDIPYGYSAAATMRIDCDESIHSGRALFELYHKLDFPFSMAIKTNQPIQDTDIQLMKDVVAAGGSVITHSHNHEPNWGGSYSKAVEELETSRKILQECLPSFSEKHMDKFLVSPFHQNPSFAVQAMMDTQIQGFVGGIVKNDPEYLQARCGHIWGQVQGQGVATHSEQCMLHGDCYRRSDADPLGVYKQAWNEHVSFKTFFGFLDHPFSEYQYGWQDEEERLKAHGDFLDYINQTPNVWRANTVEALQFAWNKSQLRYWLTPEKELRTAWKNQAYNNVPPIDIQWMNSCVAVSG